MGDLVGKLELGKNFLKTIFELDVNEGSYTNPNNLEFDYNLNAYLNLDGIIEENPGENYQNIYVRRIGMGKNDFLVDISKIEGYMWRRKNEIFNYPIEEITEDEEINIAIINSLSIEEQIKKAVDREDYELAEKLKNQLI